MVARTSGRTYQKDERAKEYVIDRVSGGVLVSLGGGKKRLCQTIHIYETYQSWIDGHVSVHKDDAQSGRHHRATPAEANVVAHGDVIDVGWDARIRSYAVLLHFPNEFRFRQIGGGARHACS